MVHVSAHNLEFAVFSAHNLVKLTNDMALHIGAVQPSMLHLTWVMLGPTLDLILSAAS